MSGTTPAIYRDGIRYGGGFGFNGVTEIKIGDEIYTPNDGLVEIPQATIEIDAVPTANSENAVQSGGVYDALQDKQDNLLFDQTPTENSTNPVTSGGVYDAIQGAGGGASLIPITSEELAAMWNN